MKVKKSQFHRPSLAAGTTFGFFLTFFLTYSWIPVGLVLMFLAGIGNKFFMQLLRIRDEQTIPSLSVGLILGILLYALFALLSLLTG